MSTIRSFALLAVLVAALSPLAARAQLTAGGTGNASGTPSVALSAGGAANATAVDTIAIGSNATASGIGGIAIGSAVPAAAATATGSDSVAIGTHASAGASGTAALGLNSQAAGVNAVAVGNGANASAAGAVAIGSGSQATQANTVSVGAAGAERRVTNVAAGVSGTDAVNVDQLNAVALGGAAPAVDQLNTRVGALESRVDELTRNSYRGIAGVAALAGAVPTTPGKTTVNLGVGTYQGYSAVGIAAAHLSSSGRYNVNAGLSYSGGEPVGRVGVGFTF
ncbi:MAG TPA: YadA-like family protein [Burkholderiales bacterium]|jgi:autotransporter adhesin